MNRVRGPSSRIPRIDEALKPVECLKCGHIWFPRVKDPVQCPNCKSPNWNRRW